MVKGFCLFTGVSDSHAIFAQNHKPRSRQCQARETADVRDWTFEVGQKPRQTPTPPGVLGKSPQAIENKQSECEKERKERKRVRNGMIRRDLRLRWDSPWMHLEVLRGALDRYTPTIVGRPVATGSMRKVLRMEEILTLRGARDGRSWLRKHTRGCGRIRRPNADTISNLGLKNTASVTTCQVIN
jgi:hypothetical protein